LNGEIKICGNCGESVYLEGEEIIAVCPKWGKTISHFEGRD